MILMLIEKYLRLYVRNDKIWNSTAEAFLGIKQLTVTIYHRDKWSLRKRILTMWSGLIQGTTSLVIKRGVQQQKINSKTMQQ